MNIADKSKEYAKGKALDAMTAAIEQAYADGYNDGLKHYENERLESIVDGIEYKDLKLKSGTRWASSYVMDNEQVGKFTYEEASKLNLPTKEDYEELFYNCAKDYNLAKGNKGIKFTGKNGEELIIPYVKINELQDIIKSEYFAFWLKDEGDEARKLYAYMRLTNSCDTPKLFMGYKLPVLLVRKEK